MMDFYLTACTFIELLRIRKYLLVNDKKNLKRRTETAHVTNAQTCKGYVNNYEKNRFKQFAMHLYSSCKQRDGVEKWLF